MKESKACKPQAFCVGKVLILQYYVKGAAHSYSSMLEHLKEDPITVLTFF